MIWIDNSRIIAILAVVFLHVAAGIVLNNDIGTEFWWYGNVFDSAVRWCVPVFVMLSGALLLDTNKQEPIFIFYKKRLSRVLFPLVFWSFFYLIWFALRKDNATFTDLIDRVLSGKPYYHMWFLYMIMGLYLFTPFFRKIVVNSSRKEIKVLIFLSFILSAINFAYRKFTSGEPGLFINWFLLFVPYFFLGYLIRTDKNEPPLKVLFGTLIGSFLLTCGGCYFVSLNSDLKTGLYFYGYLSISVIPMSISAMYLLKTLNKAIFNNNITQKLSALTLGIYLVHPAILDIVKDITYILVSRHPMVSVFAVTSLIFIISLGVSWIFNKTPYLRRCI